MRTTLNIDEDVLYAVKERAQREKRSAGEVLSDLARDALTGATSTGPESDSKAFYGFRPFPHRGTVVTNELIDRIRDEENV